MSNLLDEILSTSPYFPQVMTCSACGGLHSIWYKGQTITDTELVVKVFAAKEIYYKRDPNRHVCDCAETIPLLKAQVDAIGIELDSGWERDDYTSNSRRGISDFNRRIKFNKKLSDNDLKVIVEWLRKDKCPGWTGIYVNKISDKEYIFSTTYDSSD